MFINPAHSNSEPLPRGWPCLRVQSLQISLNQEYGRGFVESGCSSRGSHAAATRVHAGEVGFVANNQREGWPRTRNVIEREERNELGEVMGLETSLRRMDLETL